MPPPTPSVEIAAVSAIPENLDQIQGIEIAVTPVNLVAFFEVTIITAFIHSSAPFNAHTTPAALLGTICHG